MKSGICGLRREVFKIMSSMKIYLRLTAMFLMAVILASFVAKQPEKLTPSEFKKWVLSPTSGLQHKVSQGSYDYIMSYLPLEFMALQQLKGDEINKRAFNKKQEELRGTEYYTFMISLNNGSKNVIKSLVEDTEIPADQMVHFMAYNLQHDIHLVKGADTLKCAFLHFEETFEITSYARFMIMFSDDTQSRRHVEDRQLIVSFPWLGDPLAFRINKENIKSVPKVIVK